MSEHFYKECRFYILLSVLVIVLYVTQASIQQRIMLPCYDGTAVIEAIESDSVRIFQEVIHSALTYVMAFVYLVMFYYALIFTFVILMYYKETLLFKRFSLMFCLNYLIAFPFFIFFNVSVAGAALPNVQPLLYEQFPRMFLVITSVDPLDNCFPSLHVAMIFSAFLIMRGTMYKRHKILLYFGFPATVFAVLYLGIHWIIDVFAGLALGFFTYYLAKSIYDSSQTISSEASSGKK